VNDQWHINNGMIKAKKPWRYYIFDLIKIGRRTVSVWRV